MLARLRHAWQKKQVDPRWNMLFEEMPDEVVSLDCETTSLNVREAELLSIGAVRIRRGRILASESLYLLVRPEHLPAPGSVVVHGLRPSDLSDGLAPADAVSRLLEFIGGRALVGYYLEYDVAVLNKYVKPLTGITLPQRQIEVSGLYYDLKYQQNPDAHIDLRLTTLMTDLELPQRAAHNPVNDATMAALAFIKLQGLNRL